MSRKAKKWYQSRTIWLNLITPMLGILGALDPQTLNDLGITSKQFIGGLGLTSAILNVILRVNTSQAIQAKGAGTIEPKAPIE